MTGLIGKAVRGLEYLVYLFVLIGGLGLLFLGSMLVIFGGAFLINQIFH